MTTSSFGLVACAFAMLLLLDPQTPVLANNNMLMMPGDRVQSLDRTKAICRADMISDPDIPTERTIVNYYYAIESSSFINSTDADGRKLITNLEEILFWTVQDAIIWCYYDETDPNAVIVSRSHEGGRILLSPEDKVAMTDQGQAGIVVEEDGRSLGRLSLNDARRLNILTYSTSPADEQEFNIACNFPYNETNSCIVMHGMVTLVHQATSNMSLVTASILDATEMAMTHSDTMILSDGPENIVNLQWLGETEEDAINGGPDGGGGGGSSSEARRSSVPVAYAVSVPLLVLLAFALLLVRNKTRRQVLTPEQMLALDSATAAGQGNTVYVGTGDPPRSFHEGMYHYTRHGARYLSTNCDECAETKHNGFFTASDLETINEEGQYGQSYEDISLVGTSASAETGTSSESEHNPSDHRKRNYVMASDAALGKKHSSIDVHQCTSATCHICAYRPRDVNFVGQNTNPALNQYPLDMAEVEV